MMIWMQPWVWCSRSSSRLSGVRRQRRPIKLFYCWQTTEHTPTH